MQAIRMKLKYRIIGLFLAAFGILLMTSLLRPQLSLDDQSTNVVGRLILDRSNRESQSDSDRQDTSCSHLDTDPLDFTLDVEVIETLQEISSSIDHQIPRSSHRMLNIHHYGSGRSYKTEEQLPSWKRFQNQMSPYKLYREGATLENYIRDLSHQPLISFKTIPDKGTQLKLVYELKDKGRAMFKPKRLPIDAEASIDQYTFDEFERFHAEIAAFHLDRILEFYRVPPTVGRLVNMSRDILAKAPSDFRKTFYKSRVGNLCFYGRCDQFCDKPFASCGDGVMLAGSFAAYLPSRTQVPRQSWDSPWAQSYSRTKSAVWKNNNTYCDVIRKKSPYNRGRRLLDIMDMAVFDFLIGNLDRHSYHTFKTWGNDSNIILYDNGRGFGRSRYDILDLLAPLTQCCLFRLSTLDKLMEFYTGEVTLSAKLRASLAKDLIHPLLTESHFKALDRRVKIILDSVHKCVEENGGGYETVIINDGF